MITWTLFLMIFSQTGDQSFNSLSLPGFATEAACAAAGQKIYHYSVVSPQRGLISVNFTCVRSK